MVEMTAALTKHDLYWIIWTWTSADSHLMNSCRSAVAGLRRQQVADSRPAELQKAAQLHPGRPVVQHQDQSLFSGVKLN